MQDIYDISFAGATVNIDGITIDDFMDDQNPVDFQDTDVANIEWSCNGRMLRTVKPSAVMMSVTVIPGSPSDVSLQKLLKMCFNNGGTVNLSEANHQIVGRVGVPGGPSYSFSSGTCVSGPLGITAQGSGKFGGNTYTFAFEKVG